MRDTTLHGIDDVPRPPAATLVAMFYRLPDPVSALKRQLAATIVERLDGWNVHYAGAWAGVRSTQISQLRNGHLASFSLQRLVRMLARLGDEVRITTISQEERRLEALRNGTPYRPLRRSKQDSAAAP